MTHAFDLSPIEHAWWSARNAYRISTAALLRGALPALGLRGGEENPYGVLGCTLPPTLGTDQSDIRIEIVGDAAKVKMSGLPIEVMREVLVPRAGLYFSPFTAETSLRRTTTEGQFTTRGHGATQRLTVRAGSVADADLTLPVLVAARSLRAVAWHTRLSGATAT